MQVPVLAVLDIHHLPQQPPSSKWLTGLQPISTGLAERTTETNRTATCIQVVLQTSQTEHNFVLIQMLVPDGVHMCQLTPNTCSRVDPPRIQYLPHALILNGILCRNTRGGGRLTNTSTDASEVKTGCISGSSAPTAIRSSWSECTAPTVSRFS